MLIQPAANAQSVNTAKAINTAPAFIDNLVTNMQILPGVGVAIVHKDKVVFSESFGVSDIETGKAFTKDMQTYIASGSKAFLGLVIANLEQKGELDLDAPIGQTYLTDLNQENLGDFADLSFKQLLTHTHGLNGDPVGFRTAYSGDMEINEFWNVIGKLTTSKSGNAFEYSNFGYLAAGYVLEHIYKESWQTLVSRHVLNPLGMTQTTSRISDLVEKEFAKPHIWHGKTRRIPIYKRDATMHAAGGHYSTIDDMARWLNFNINAGVLDNKQIFTAETVKTTQAPVVDLDKTFYRYKRYAHGFGWYLSKYKGNTLKHHFGAFPGYRAHISFMPDHKLGVVVLSNDLSRPSINLPDMIANYIYDTALEEENIDSEYTEELSKITELIAPIKGSEIPVRPTNAPPNTEGYTGVFVNDVWGTISFTSSDNKFTMHWGQVSFDPIWTIRKGVTYLRFELAGNGYLLKPNFSETGVMTSFDFSHHLFKRR